VRFTQIVSLFFVLMCYGCVLSSGIQGGKIWIEHNDAREKVTYQFYLPNTITAQKVPVLICVGGLPVIDGDYFPTDTETCLQKEWMTFADQNEIAILSLGLLFKPEDWPERESFQFPEIWSGQALFKILETLSQTNPIDSRRLYFYGISAGAQFAIRFALWHPEITKAVTAHAGGGYDFPKTRIPTSFLITVGELDSKRIDRVGMAKTFVARLHSKKIVAELKIVPELGHVQTEEQDEWSRQFIQKDLLAKSSD